MTRAPAARRPAFTLVELLVVIAIIAILAAITAGVFSRVRQGQAKSATDATLNKINSLIERRWKAVLDQVNDDVKTKHPGYVMVLTNPSVQNPDLAKAIWTHARMKNEFPMSFNEARSPTLVQGGAIASPVLITSLPAKAAFASLPAGAAGGSPEESAACLYLAVTTNAGGGTATDQDGVQQQSGDVVTASGTFRAFKDVWGTPIAFVRTVFNSEVNAPPFVPQGKTAGDPFDPRGKLVTTGFATNNPAWWNATRAPVTWVTTSPASYPAGFNFVPTAISAGPDQKWGADPYGLPPIVDTDPSKDNQLSYRLRREGARGD